MTEPSGDLMAQEQRANLWSAVGGDPTFLVLVEAFYRRVEADPLLRPIFPPDLASGREKQFMFLVQYFGGGQRYSAVHGHPRLRMRHVPFRIDRVARDRWLAHMLAAIDDAGIREPWRSEMRGYFEMASAAMMNA